LLTNGAFAALAVVLGAIVDPGDEVIFLSPPWFFYEALIAAAGARPVRVKIDPTTFDLDLDAIKEQLSIDIPHLQRKRDRMVVALREIGYELHTSEGTFYLLPRSPLPDDEAFIELLAEQNIFCLPGTVVELPGYFRISLTANDTMIEQALPGFAIAHQKATRGR
jgi:aspartate/methionine/tyrosine aminotransferase